MNNRIMAMLCALAAAMFLSIVPVKAEAAVTEHKHIDTNKNCVCDVAGCKEAVHNWSVGYDSNAEAHWKNCLNGCGAKHEEAEHTYGDFSDQGAAQHWRTCTVCKYVDKQSHVDKDGNCKCDDCGRQLDHQLEKVAAVAPACEKAGTYEHYKCKVCGKLFSAKDWRELEPEEIVWPALEHNWSEKWFSNDNTHWHICKNDDCKSKNEEAAHVLKFVDNGNGTHCAQCELCEEIPDSMTKMEHNYAVAETNATAKEHKLVCEDCGSYKWEKCADKNGDCACDVCGGEYFHSPVEVKKKNPTCTEEGMEKHSKCQYCDALFVNGVEVDKESLTIAAKGHKKDSAYVWDADEHWLKCLNKGCDEKLDAAAHEFVYVDCNNGWHEYVCKVCGAKDATRTGEHKDENKDCKCDMCGAQMAHSPVLVEATEPNCTEEGMKEHSKCQYCGALFLNGIEVDKEALIIPANGHNWSYKQIINNKHLAYCPDCRTYDLLEHEDTNGDCLCDIKGCTSLVHSHRLVIHAEVPATCEEDGTEAYYTYQDCGKMFDLDQQPIEEPKVIEATGHEMSGEWIPGENGQHVMYCLNCDYCEVEDHVFVNGNVTCDICGAEENLTKVPAKAATCTEQGNVEYWTSRVTGKKYADEAGTRELKDVTIPATGHELTGFVDNGNGTHSQHCQNGDCKYEESNGAHKAAENGCFCADCGASLDGHKLTLVPAVAATCEKAGTEAYFQCSCGKLYDMGYKAITAPKAIAKLSHTTDGTVKKDAKEGKHYTECTTCGKKFYEEHMMAVKDPLKGNYHQYVCECGELKVETHYDKDGDGVCDVCDHNMSSSSVTVEQHDNVTVKTGDSSTNKNYTWWRNWLEILVPGNSGGSEATVEKESTASSNQQSASANQNQTASAGASQNSTSNSGTTSSGTNTGASKTTVNNNALAQFFTWFLGLFGF